MYNWAPWHMHVIVTLRRWRQGDGKLKNILGQQLILMLAWDTEDLIQNKTRKNSYTNKGDCHL